MKVVPKIWLYRRARIFYFLWNTEMIRLGGPPKPKNPKPNDGGKYGEGKKNNHLEKEEEGIIN